MMERSDAVGGQGLNDSSGFHLLTVWGSRKNRERFGGGRRLTHEAGRVFEWSRVGAEMSSACNSEGRKSPAAEPPLDRFRHGG